MNTTKYIDPNPGRRLAQLRKEMSLRQEDFAAKLGITGAAISAIERGRAPITEEKYKLFCLVFNVRREWLEGGAGEIYNEAKVVENKKELILEMFEKLTPSARVLAENMLNEILLYELKEQKRKDAAPAQPQAEMPSAQEAAPQENG